jgi:hypothetical protein
MRNAYKILVERTQQKENLGDLNVARVRIIITIKMNL